MSQQRNEAGYEVIQEPGGGEVLRSGNLID
jgi:hypothetical protein